MKNLQQKVLLSFDQVNIKTGQFHRINKLFDPNQGGKTVELSPNEFTNKEDSIGLLHFEPDPKKYLSIVGTETMSHVLALEQRGINSWYAMKI